MSAFARTLTVSATLMAAAAVLAAEPRSAFSGPMSRTAGGSQFWADVALFHQWRIQRNALTGHHRLLDPTDRRHASGDLETCRDTLSQLREQEGLPPMDGEAVVILHGLGGSRGQMRPLHDYLADRGYQVFSVGYPSTRGGVDQHAEQLAHAIESLVGVDRIHFVAHSLGNLVIRRWMARNSDPTTGAPIDERVGRLVMLGPPNHRPLMATYLEPLDLSNQLAGQSGRELNRDWDQLEPKLALPEREFGIIAGGKGDGEGWNPFIPGDDDLTVGVEETKLTGASDFRVVEVIHRSMASSRAVHELTLAFLQEGRFGKESERRRLGKP